MQQCDTFSCAMCNVRCHDAVSYQRHCTGKKHIARTNAAAAATVTPAAVPAARVAAAAAAAAVHVCAVCAVDCHDAAQLQSHLAGRAHAAALPVYRRAYEKAQRDLMRYFEHTAPTALKFLDLSPPTPPSAPRATICTPAMNSAEPCSTSTPPAAAASVTACHAPTSNLDCENLSSPSPVQSQSSSLGLSASIHDRSLASAALHNAPEQEFADSVTEFRRVLYRHELRKEYWRYVEAVRQGALRTFTTAHDGDDHYDEYDADPDWLPRSCSPSLSPFSSHDVLGFEEWESLCRGNADSFDDYGDE